MSKSEKINQVDYSLLGSETAKNGFKNERDIVEKFNEWKNDDDAKKWLIIMGYSLSEIESVKAYIIHQSKTDVQVIIHVKLKEYEDVQNLQVKLVSGEGRGYNQIDKRWVDKYKELWQMDEDVVEILKHYTGELPPTVKKPRDKRRMFIDEFSDEKKVRLLKFFEDNKVMILTDIFKGRGRMSAEWMLVAQKMDSNARWVLKPMNVVMNYFGKGNVEISNRGNISIGRITVQRKGGDGGRKTACMLQFKISPAELFNLGSDKN